MSLDDQISEGPDGGLSVTRSLSAELHSIRDAIASGLATISTKLDGKADKADVLRLESVLDNHGERISDLEQKRHDDDVAAGVRAASKSARFTRREKILGALGVLFLGATTIVSPILAVRATKH